MTDARELLHRLIARKSVTPDDGGCLDLVADVLAGAGFDVERLDAGEVSNLWATWGDEKGLLAFAGHVDVVPPGDREDWTSDPFTPEERDGFIYGRGACDMKGSVAAMVCAAVDARASGKIAKGGLGILLTSDEEGPAIDGTDHVVRELSGRGVRLRHCVVGEPTSLRSLGDTIKHGRRGTLNAILTFKGKQGHSAYPDRCANSNHGAIRLLGELVAKDWDRPDREPAFSPTSFQVTDVRGGLGATNVVPGETKAIIDIRYAPPETGESLKAQITDVLDRAGADYDCEWLSNAEPYSVGTDTELARALSGVVAGLTGSSPAFATVGGTSDARFLWRISDELVEFGPLLSSMHQHDEHIGIEELEQTKKIYEDLIYKLLV